MVVTVQMTGRCEAGEKSAVRWRQVEAFLEPASHVVLFAPVYDKTETKIPFCELGAVIVQDGCLSIGAMSESGHKNSGVKS